MPIISDVNKAVLNRLLNGYGALSPNEKILYPVPLGAALASYESNPSCDSAFAICSVFLNEPSRFSAATKFVKPFLKSSLFGALQVIHTRGLLTGAGAQANFNAVIQYLDPKSVASALSVLNEAGLLTEASAEANFNAVLGHEDPGSVANAVDALNAAGLLTGVGAQANFNAVVAGRQRNPPFVAKVLDTLNRASLLTGVGAQINRDAVAGHQYPEFVAKALSSLNTTGLLTGAIAQANFNAVIIHPRPSSVALALSILSGVGLLTGASAQANFNAVVGHQSKKNIGPAIRALNAAGLLTGAGAQANFNAVVQHEYLGAIVQALVPLNVVELLTGASAQANFNAVIRHKNPLSVPKAFETLKLKKLLTGDGAQANFNAVLGHSCPSDVATALCTLNTAQLLTGDGAQANRDAVVNHKTTTAVALALVTLYKVGLLTGDDAQANRNAVVKHKQPLSAARTLYVLNDAGLLTGASAQANRDAVLGHKDARQVAEALAILQKEGLLTGDSAQANRDAVLGHKKSRDVAGVLNVLYARGLLKGTCAQTNFNTVVGQQDPKPCIVAFSKLSTAGILTGGAAQGVFDSVMITHSAILFHPETRIIWERIPDHLFTRERFDAIIAICNNNQETAPNRRQRLITYVTRDILGTPAQQAGGGAPINQAQSTHTASVHASVSKSARALSERYGARLSGAGCLDDTLREIHQWLSKTPDDALKIPAAKRCLARLTSHDSYFEDQTSAVSIQQLLAFIWLAINDKEYLIGTPVDAKHLLIEGLYETQRGYNLLPEGGDDGNVNDRHICMAGTFNKLMEKCVGIIPDVEVIYIRMETFVLKMPIVVMEESLRYLESLRGKDDKLLSELIQQIKARENDFIVDPLWKAIRSRVAERMMDEFGRLFDGNKEHPDFVGNLKTGKWVKLKPQSLELFNQPHPAQALPGEGGGAAALCALGFFSGPGGASSEGNAPNHHSNPKL